MPLSGKRHRIRDAVVVLSAVLLTGAVTIALLATQRSERGARSASLQPLRHIPEDARPGSGTTPVSGATPSEQSPAQLGDAGVVVAGRVLALPEHAPLEGAQVDLVIYGNAGSALDALAAAKVAASASTNPQGAFRLGGVATTQTLVRATKRGFVPAYAFVPPGGQELLLELDSGGTIRGRVVDEADHAVPGATVHAWNPRVPSPFEVAADLDNRRAQLRHIRQATSDASGNFEITDVCHGVTYRLVASSSTRVLARPYVESSAGAPPVTLTLHPVFLMWAQLREVDGGVLAIDPRANALSGGGVTVQFPQGQPMPIAEDSWRLPHSALTIPEALRGKRFDMHQVVMWFVVDSTEPKLGPYPLRASVPGYGVLRADVWARRLDTVVGPDTLHVARRTTNFVPLRLVFLRDGAPLAATEDYQTELGFIAMSREDHPGDDDGLRIEITSIPDAPVTLQSVPAAPYRIRLKSRIPGFDITPDRLELGRGGDGGEVRISVPRLMRLAVEVQTDPGKDILRLIDRSVLRIQRHDPAEPQFRLTWTLGDYMESAFVVPPGTYRIEIRSMYPDQLVFDACPKEWVAGADPAHVVVDVTNVRGPE